MHRYRKLYGKLAWGYLWFMWFMSAYMTLVRSLSQRHPLNMHLETLSVIFTSVLCCAFAHDPAECDYSETYYTIFKIGQHSCTCQPDRAGQLKFSDGKVLVCTGSEWKALQYEVSYGSKSNPGYGCDDIKAKNVKQTANGIYWITLSGEE